MWEEDRDIFAATIHPLTGLYAPALFSIIQLVWSKQHDGCSLAQEIPAADVGRIESYIS